MAQQFLDVPTCLKNIISAPGKAHKVAHGPVSHQCLPSKSPLHLHPACNERRRAANARWVETTCNSTRDCSVSVGLPQHPFMREHSRTRMSSAEAKPAQYTLETESTTLRTVRRRGWASPRSPPCKTTLFSFSSYGPCSAQPSVKQNIYGNIRLSRIWVHLLGPYNKDYRIWGSILRSPLLENCLFGAIACWTQATAFSCPFSGRLHRVFAGFNFQAPRHSPMQG